MVRYLNPKYSNNLIDAHVLDRTGGLEDAVVDEILARTEAGEFTLLLPHSVKAEIEHPNTPADVKRRATQLLFTEPVELTPPEIHQHRKIQDIMRGNAKAGKHDRDAFHVVESAKYGGHFITNDDRILKKRAEIARLLQVEIVTPTEFLAKARMANGECLGDGDER